MPDPLEFECAVCGKKGQRPPFPSKRFIPEGWLEVVRISERPWPAGGGVVYGTEQRYFCCPEHRDEWLKEHPPKEDDW